MYTAAIAVIPLTVNWSNNPPSSPKHCVQSTQSQRQLQPELALLHITPALSELGRAFQFTAHSPPPSLKFKASPRSGWRRGWCHRWAGLSHALVQWGNWIIRQMSFANARGGERSQNEVLSLPKLECHLVCRQPLESQHFLKFTTTRQWVHT